MNLSELRKEIADRLRQARELAGLSQTQAAKFLGLQRPSISEIEAGRRKVSAEELTVFAEIYGVDIDWLAGANLADTSDPKYELAAREIAKMKPEDVQRLRSILRMLRSDDKD